MTNLIESQRRRLLRHGFIFLFLGLWLGIATAVLPHPRAWLSAHLTAFLTCFVLVSIGMVWRELRLTERQRTIALVTGLTSAYTGLIGNVFTAITDLPGPASQPGVVAPMPQAAVFFTLLAVVVPSTLVAFGVVMYGMRGEPASQQQAN
jgi:hypothetical protein